MKLDVYFTPLAKINLKRIKDLNTRPDITKFLEGNVRKKLADIGLGNFFGHDPQNANNRSEDQ